MRKVFLILALTLPWSAATGEPIDPNPDGIGIYADVDGQVNQVDVEVGTPMEVYVLMTRPTGTETGMLVGVEFTIVLPDNIDIWGWNTPMPGTFALTDPPDFMMVFQKVPYQDVHHVLTLIVVPTDAQPAQFYLTALQHAAGGDAPRYCDTERMDLYDLTPYPGGQENMSFVINGEIVPDEATSWSEVKALYR